MAEPFDTYAEQMAEALGLDLDADQLALLSALFFDLTPAALTQLQQSLTLLGRIDGLIFTSGAPSNVVGAPGSVAIDIVGRKFYGPKHEVTGWPDGTPFLEGPAGLSAKAIVIAAGQLLPGATDAQFATWLKNGQVAAVQAAVQPLVDAAQASAAATAADAAATEADRVAAQTAGATATAKAGEASDDAAATAADRVATAADAAATEADRVAAQTAAATATAKAGEASDDAVATAADRVATAADAAATEADRVAAQTAAATATAKAGEASDDAATTAADRVATAADAAATEADRVAAQTAATTATTKASEASDDAVAVAADREATQQLRDEAEQFRNEAGEIVGGNFVTGPEGAASDSVPLFSGTSGKALKAGRAIGASAATDLIDRATGDTRYRRTDVALTKDDVGLPNVSNTADADKPVSTAQQTALNAKADLVGGKVPAAQLPALAITDVFEVASQSAMLALIAERGDVAIRTDLNKSFVLATDSPSTLADWKELRTPTDLVLSVAGQTGAITAAALRTALALAISDISGLQTALDAKAATSAMPVKASGSDLRGLSDDAKFVTAKAVADAMAYAALTDASTVAINLASGANFTLLTTSGVGTNRTLGAPSGVKPGMTFAIEITSDAANRTMAYNSVFKFPGGAVPAITTTSGRRDRLVCQCTAGGFIDAQLIKDVR